MSPRIGLGQRLAAAGHRPSPRPSLRRTALAFALAPGVAAAACVCYFALRSLSDPSRFGLWRDLAAAGEIAAASGYAAAVVFGLPLYVLVPARRRGSLGTLVPLGSVSAAAPWLLSASLSRSDRPFALGMAVFALASGAVGGLAFWVIRRGWRR